MVPVMKNYNRIANKIFKVLKSSGYTVAVFDVMGNETLTPEDGRWFFVKQPNMMVSLDEIEGEIRMSKNSSYPLEAYENTLAHLKNVAVKYVTNFTIKNYGKDIMPKDFAYKALKDTSMYYDPIKEAALSRMSGSKKTSYQTLENVKIHVKHRKAVDEDVRGSRARNIQSIFLEQNGERFRFPHSNLSGARAMARHMQYGGSINDAIGEHIVTTTGNFIKLKEFMRYVSSNKLITEDTSNIVSLIKENVHIIKEELKRFAGSKTYETAKARVSSESAVQQVDEDSINELKDMFTVRRFDEKMSEVLPLISNMVTENDAYLMRIEAASANAIKLTSEGFTKTNAVLEFDSPTGMQGYMLKNMSSQIVENDELANYIAEVGTRMMKSVELNEFEKNVIKNVLENMSQVGDEQPTSIFNECVSTFIVNVNKYDAKFV